MSETTTTEAYEPKVDDMVVIHPDYTRPQHVGVIYKVVDTSGRVYVIIQRENGGRLKVRAHQIMPVPASGSPFVVTPYLAPLSEGQVIHVEGPEWKEPKGVLYVVLGDTKGQGGTKLRIAKLGGNNGRYWPSVPRSWCKPITGRLAIVETEATD